jgi:hypothetical protein
LAERTQQGFPFEGSSGPDVPKRCHHRSCFLLERWPGLQSLCSDRLVPFWFDTPALAFETRMNVNRDLRGLQRPACSITVS